ncbi:hypothetical protein ACJ41O_014778 [Fusarium nematophilum]
MGQTESTESITPTLSPEIQKLGFPKRLTVSYKRSWTNSPALLLSEPGSDPSLIATFADGRFGDITLHSGPTGDDAPLAIAKPSGYHRDYTVILPSCDGGSRDEQLQFKCGFFGGKVWFDMEVRGGRRERFEWKRSYGSQVRGLGGWWGRELVRMKSDKTAGGVLEKIVNHDPEKTMDAPDEQDDLERDGGEVVAVWADAVMSFSKVGEFQFRSAGATGEFGQVWALMAFLTCVCVWQKHEYEMYMQLVLSDDS